MPTIRDQILEAAKTFLNASPAKPANVALIERTLMQPTELAALPVAMVFPFREEVQPNASGKWGPVIGRSLYLRFAAWAQGDPADAALDPIIAWISTLGGQTLGGLVDDMCEHELTWSYDEQNYQVAGVAVDFLVQYSTLRGDATST
jgi:hypothetical protein